MLIPEGAPCYIFYDPDQNIFTKELKLPDFGLPPVLLTKNCRNTRKIYEMLRRGRMCMCCMATAAPCWSRSWSGWL